MLAWGCRQGGYPSSPIDFLLNHNVVPDGTNYSGTALRFRNDFPKSQPGSNPCLSAKFLANPVELDEIELVPLGATHYKSSHLQKMGFLQINITILFML
jgi:hypothetical protein